MSEYSGPFHAGELYVQQRTGTQREAQINGRIIAPEIPAGAVPFITAQQLVVFGSLNAQGQVWASLAFGSPGFVSVPDNQHIVIQLADLRADAADAWWANSGVGGSVGVLLLDLGTRRRFRLNGTISHRTADHLTIAVQQAFPNCPKYIQRRQPRQLPPVAMAEAVVFSAFDSGHQALLHQADTFFVASINADAAVDVSHRGGPPGFVRVLDATTLLIPDYPGNGMFNTLGNFVSVPRAGLLFFDFDSGRMLQLTGAAQIVWAMPGTTAETGSTQRFWQFSLHTGQELLGLRGGAWSAPEFSPFNP
jgi:predicted pyridoxine 5'-phosphate oxidase superfamily flavin-nucleotide-binding protein